MSDGSVTKNKQFFSENFNDLFVNVGPTLAKCIPKIDKFPLEHMENSVIESIHLTDLPWNEMTAISQTTFPNIFVHEKFCILLYISLKFVSKRPISNILELIQIMALCRIGEKPLSEPLLTHSLTHICGARGDELNPVTHEDIKQILLSLRNYATG